MLLILDTKLNKVEMMRFHVCWIASLLLSSLSFVSSNNDDGAAVAPFFVRRDEGGELVIMVVYGPHDFEQVAVYCHPDDNRHTVQQGPGMMQCVKKNNDERYELFLPFQFVRNNHGQITGVSFDDPDGMVIPFRLRETSEGVTVAEATGEASVSIPYEIEYHDDGGIVAMVFYDDDETRYEIPMEFIMDGSRVVGVAFEDKSSLNEGSSNDKGFVLDVGITGIVLGLAILVSIGFYVQKRQEQRSMDSSDDDASYDVAKSDVSDPETTADFDDMETIPVL